jgi:hypothetical protein
MTNRKITTHYEAADGTEPDITVEVEQQDRFTAIVIDDLDDLGVPADEQPGVRDRAIAAFWAAERSDWLQSPEGEASGQ